MALVGFVDGSVLVVKKPVLEDGVGSVELAEAFGLGGSRRRGNVRLPAAVAVSRLELLEVPEEDTVCVVRREGVGYEMDAQNHSARLGQPVVAEGGEGILLAERIDCRSDPGE